MPVELTDNCVPRYTPSTGKLRASDKRLFYLKNDDDIDLVFIVKLKFLGTDSNFADFV